MNGEQGATGESGRRKLDRAKVLALTVSGGVSLGSYEAGQLHLLTEALRRSPGSAKVRVATGASAGSANAVVAGTEACLDYVELPERSLGYKVWVEVGIDDLFDPHRVTENALFHRDALTHSLDHVLARWKKGIPRACDFVFGVAVTRENAFEVELAPGLTVPRQAEHFVVRVQGRGAEVAPAFNNYIDPTRRFQRPLLPLTDGGDRAGTKDGSAVRQAVLASAAFPVAFAPQPIEHCLTPEIDAPKKTPAESLQCPVATRVDAFVDGGVFDNNPLGMAYVAVNAGLVPDASGDPVLRPVPEGEKTAVTEVVYGYIDPDLRTYPIFEPATSKERKHDDPVLSLLSRIGGQALDAARGQELAWLAETSSEIQEQLWLVHGNYPPLSELLSAFFGFFEHDFRDFDFHLGSYDTFVELRRERGRVLGVESFIGRLHDQFRGSPKAVEPRYRKLGCILAHTEADVYGHLGELCTGAEMENFRILLQVTLDRLWSNCRLADPVKVNGSSHLQCKRAKGGVLPPAVNRHVVPPKERYRAPEESEFDYVMRLLAAYRFAFRDLGLSRDDADKGRLAIRRKLIAMVEALGDAQPSSVDRNLVITTGRTLVNTIEYEPPPHRVYFLVGSSLAAGYLGRIGDTSSLFWNPDARMHNLRDLITDRPVSFGGSFTLGLEWAVLPLSGSIVQVSLGARGGYQLVAEDDIGLSTCDEMAVSSDSRECSQPVIHTPVNVTLLERVRLAITPIFYPVGQPFGHNAFDLELGVGAEFY